MFAMHRRVLLLTLSLILPLARAQTSSFPHREVTLAETDFIDIGPPFDYYNLYRMTATVNGTDVERVSITPSAGSCALPTTEVKSTHVPQSLSEMFAPKDPCTISNKAAQKEAKRCKHCPVFSGVHVSVQLACGTSTRAIRYEILDRDLFEEKPNTPGATSRTLNLLASLNKAFEGGAFDKPAFVTPAEQPITRADPSDELILQVKSGVFDALFNEKISQLYLDSFGIPRLPTVELTSVNTTQPSSFQLPVYPAIARAAHIEGTVIVSAVLDESGAIQKVEYEHGPQMLAGATIDAVKNWKFPAGAATQAEIGITFHLNCPDAAMR